MPESTGKLDYIFGKTTNLTNNKVVWSAKEEGRGYIHHVTERDRRGNFVFLYRGKSRTEKQALQLHQELVDQWVDSEAYCYEAVEITVCTGCDKLHARRGFIID